MIARAGLEAREIAPYLASLLSIPDEGRYPVLEMAPSELKERTVAALIALFEGLTQGAPALALLEDAHWIDPTSLDVFNRIIERLPRLRALLVITFRPEFVAPWVGRAHVASLPLNRFGRRQAVTMIGGLTAGKALPAEVLDEIVAKTDGVPLFVEELTKTVLESGLLREESGSYVLAAALTPLAIPSTLQDSLMARLDRLAPGWGDGLCDALRHSLPGHQHDVPFLPEEVVARPIPRRRDLQPRKDWPSARNRACVWSSWGDCAPH
jgi:predicted ATPase